MNNKLNSNKFNSMEYSEVFADEADSRVFKA